jgi:hypothetical protein
MKINLPLYNQFSTISLITLLPFFASAQMVYNDYEPNGISFHQFGTFNGVLDPSHANPAKAGINTSDFCAKYTRNDTLFYDVINLNLVDLLQGVENYAVFGGAVPKIKMKLFTSELPGTIIDLQLGRIDDLNYPSGVHSHYRGFTTVSNEWEFLEFDYIDSPSASLTGPGDIDRISIFFEPETFSNSTFYFDELQGPDLISVSIASNFNKQNDLGHSFPNPAKNIVNIPFSLSESQNITIELFDISGKVIAQLAHGNYSDGKHVINFPVNNLPAGHYSYRLITKDNVQTKKMVILPLN